MKNCSITFILIYIVNMIKMFLMKISGDLDDISISEGGTHPKMVQNTNRLTVDKRALISSIKSIEDFVIIILVFAS